MGQREKGPVEIETSGGAWDRKHGEGEVGHTPEQNAKKNEKTKNPLISPSPKRKGQASLCVVINFTWRRARSKCHEGRQEEGRERDC